MEGSSSDQNERLRALPGVDRVISEFESSGHPQPVIARLARRAVEEARQEILDGSDSPSFEDVVARVNDLLGTHRTSLLQPVINATGVLIHTNLGRVPLGEEQVNAVRDVVQGYSNLEYDLAAGRRGDRYSHAGEVLATLTGAESALVVNNNAAAVLLVLSALCRDKEVIISRGELVEIGGEFRIPDVMELSGARLVEVGTTNRTHIADYERAITPNTAAIMKVHPSNFSVVGFTASVDAHLLAQLARGRGVQFLHDLGSGLVRGADLIADEPLVQVASEDGADLVTFSGDKLFGGPQAGVIAGRKELVDLLRKHPLLRAVRVDKMTLAALEETAEAHLSQRTTELPLWQLATVPLSQLEERARAMASAISGAIEDAAKVEAIPSAAVWGGGSAPQAELPSWAVAIMHPTRDPSELDTALRLGKTPVVGRVAEDRLILDLRTIFEQSDNLVTDLVVNALRE
jgi:L-seryl-tRNA(Ser) seleniumtransferase